MRWVFCTAVMLAMCGAAWADDQPKPEDLQKMYSATLEQLKDAQNRKTQLAAEKAELEKQLAEAKSQLTKLQEESEGYNARTYFMQSQLAAWMRFMASNPLIELQWKIFLNAAPPIVPGVLMQVDDREWPVSAMK